MKCKYCEKEISDFKGIEPYHPACLFLSENEKDEKGRRFEKVKEPLVKINKELNEKFLNHIVFPLKQSHYLLFGKAEENNIEVSELHPLNKLFEYKKAEKSGESIHSWELGKNIKESVSAILQKDRSKREKNLIGYAHIHESSLPGPTDYMYDIIFGLLFGFEKMQVHIQFGYWYQLYKELFKNEELKYLLVEKAGTVYKNQGIYRVKATDDYFKLQDKKYENYVKEAIISTKSAKKQLESSGLKAFTCPLPSNKYLKHLKNQSMDKKIVDALRVNDSEIFKIRKKIGMDNKKEIPISRI